MSTRYQQIIKHKQYQSHLEQIKAYEVDRIFCKHDLSHFVDVARIAYILCLENKIVLQGFDLKDIIYAAAMCHDIGRHIEYMNDISHEIASAQLCVDILQDVGYSKGEIDLIVDIILSHRSKTLNEQKSIQAFFNQADKLSRACFNCHVSGECNWDINKKNIEIKY